MITINADGRLGNRLNYFITGMHLHELTGMQFIPERIEGFINTYNTKQGVINKLQVQSRNFYHDKLNFFNNLKNTNSGIIIDNMIHRYETFKQIDVNKIKEYLTINNEHLYEKPDPSDLVIHIRLGDYHWAGGGAVIDKKLFMEVINKETFNRCIILTDDPNDSYLNDFKNMGCIIRSNSTLADFVYLKYAKKICISKSTFSWTAAYVSDADKIYFPISDNKWPYFANPGPEDADMRPLDKSNWILI